MQQFQLCWYGILLPCDLYGLFWLALSKKYKTVDSRGELLHIQLVLIDPLYNVHLLLHHLLPC